MNIFLTGGSGDVGSLLTRALVAQGHNVTSIDVATPKVTPTRFVAGSITDRAALAQAMQGIDCVIHIAAWHGVHETTRSVAEFHDLNVTGTFNTLQAAVDAGATQFIFISSTSVSDRFGIYGSTKVIGEEMVSAYAARHPHIAFTTLRPRAFIPSWNRSVYQDYLQWVEWFSKGAVHIDDFCASIVAALAHRPPAGQHDIFAIDGAYDYSPADLAAWNDQTFAKYYPEYVELARQHGIDTARKPKALDIAPDARLPGYTPRFSMRNMLEELARYGTKGPPSPL